MKKTGMILLVGLIMLGTSAQTFRPLDKEENFSAEYFEDNFCDKMVSILVKVYGGGMERVFGVLRSETRTGFFVYGKKIFYIDGPLNAQQYGQLYVCDGEAGKIHFIADITPSYTVSQYGDFIVYVMNNFTLEPDIVIKDKHNEIIKIIKKNDLKQEDVKKQPYIVSTSYDQKTNRFLFTYDIFLGGYIDLPTLQVTMLTGDVYKKFLDEYFPDAGN